jgi:hypothetical protein
MIRRLAVAGILLLSQWVVSAVRADPFNIDLQAHAADVPKAVAAVHPLADSSSRSRVLLTANVDRPITVKWTLRNADKSATVKDVLVHFFVVKQEKPNQEEVPKLTKNVLVESALKMDFKPQDRTEGEITFTVAQPGCYLIRLELKGAVGKGEREPFAALDLLVR